MDTWETRNERHGKLLKCESDFFETCDKINRAWSLAGYTGDPLINLFHALTGMAVYAEYRHCGPREMPDRTRCAR